MGALNGSAESVGWGVFSGVLAFTRLWEGGWSDHAKDPGGLTRWGITLKALVAELFDVNGDGRIDAQDLRDMTPAQRDQFYYEKYWLPMRCDQLPPPLALLHFECAVNQGKGRAPRFLQAVVGVKQDGAIGPATLGAVDAEWCANPRRVLREYALRRALHYTSLAGMVTFGKGWLRRLFDAHGEAVSMLLSEVEA